MKLFFSKSFIVDHFLMSKVEEISQRIAQIINSSNSTYVYTSECSYIAKILNELRDQISNISTSDNNELDTILSLLNKLSDTIDSFKSDKWSQTVLQIPIAKPISDLKEIFNSINESLEKIGITLKNKYDVSTDDISNDLNSIYGILADPSKINDTEIKRKLNEIEEYLISIGSPLISSSGRRSNNIQLKLQAPKEQNNTNAPDPSNTENEEEDSKEFANFQDVQAYKIQKSDYIQDPTPITVNNRYSIYKGQMKSTKEDITIMVLDQASYTEEKFQRFVNVLTAVKHPNLELFVGAVESPLPYVIVTRQNGDKLSDVIKRTAPKPENDDENDQIIIKPGYRTIIAYQIASAMAYLHSLNIFHRDLCSSNVMIDKDLNPKIINFANSRYLPEDYLTISFKPGTSSDFQAPELYDMELYNMSVDVFSFAGILYELLTGKKPFEGKKAKQIENLIKSAQRPIISPEIKASTDLLDLIGKCWSQEPKNRPSFAEIIDSMQTKTITFPSDEGIEMVKQFYSSKKIKNADFQACLDLFKQNSEEINNSYVYSHEAVRIRTFLHGYQFMLETSELANKDKIEDANIVTQLYNLRYDLENLLSTLNQTEKKKWRNIALSSSSVEIPMDLHRFMEQIYIAMTQIGFPVIKYNYINSDLAYDLRFVHSIFQKSDVVSDKKQIRMDEIENFLNEHGIELSVTQTEVSQRVEKILAAWEDYEVNREDFKLAKTSLGSGLSCEVKKATQISTKKEVAVKIFKQGFLDDDEAIFPLRREIGFLVKLKNKYLVNFVGYNSDIDKPLWIISEYIKSGDLSTAIKRNKLNPFQKTKIAFEIAQGMQYLRSQRVIHRDLKSKNVLLSGDLKTANVTPKICDFGLARTDLSLIMTNKIGTLNYMAPEVIESGSYSFKADVFSFGMLLWELYAGRSPFSWVDNAEVLDLIMNKEQLPYSKPISDDLKNLIEDARSFEPDKRPSFSEIIDRMIEKKICFNGVNPAQVDDFYDLKKQERQQEDE